MVDIHVCVSVCIYFIRHYIYYFFLLDWLLVLDSIQINLFDVKSDEQCLFRKLRWKFFFFVALKTFIFSFFVLSFPSMSSGYKRSNLQHLLLMPDTVGLWCFASCQVMMFCESCLFFLLCLKAKILWKCKRLRVPYLEKKLSINFLLNFLN